MNDIFSVSCIFFKFHFNACDTVSDSKVLFCVYFKTWFEFCPGGKDKKLC